MIKREKTSYEVGYRKPPQHTRWQKGQSGNPKGRGKGADKPLDLNAALIREFRAMITATDHHGVRKKISKFDATITQLANKGASGHLPTIRLLMPWFIQLTRENSVTSYEGANIQDVRKRIAERIELMVKRAREQDEQSKSAEAEEAGTAQPNSA